MTNPQKALIPGILLGIMFLILLSRLVTPSSNAAAATEESQVVAAENNPAEQCTYYSRYPVKIQPWCVLIETTSAEYGIDPLLVAAVMLMESGGQPEIISKAGAVGLMQVMPRDGIAATFECVNGPCFASRPTTEELKDPSFNVNYGVKMLAGLINRDGEIREALKSYGPSNYEYIYADKVLAIYHNL